MTRVAVIGAGIAGVTTAGHLLKEGLDVTVYESSSAIGGVWAYDENAPPEPAYPSAAPSIAHKTFFAPPADAHAQFAPPGPCYAGLRNNVPTELMATSLHAWPEDTPSFARHDVLAAYIRATADAAGVTGVTHLNTRVVDVHKRDGQAQWTVEAATWDDATHSAAPSPWSATYDAVVVASGHYHVPRVPPIAGLDAWKRAFPDRVQHSKAYRRADAFAGERVLLIGGSASSTDIAVELGATAAHIWQSTRNGAFDHPATMLPANAERVAEVASFGWVGDSALDPLDPLDSPATLPVTLVDGTVVTGVDRVIVATGYQFSLPFLPQLHDDEASPVDADADIRIVVGRDGQQLHNLHEDIWWVADPSLAFVGVPFYTATFSLFDFQAIAVAAHLAGHTPPLPTVDEQRQRLRERTAAKGHGKLFHSLWGEDVAYAARLMRWVKGDTRPGDSRAGDKRPGDKRYPDGYADAWVAEKARFAALKNAKNSLYEAHQPGGRFQG